MHLTVLGGVCSRFSGTCQLDTGHQVKQRRGTETGSRLQKKESRLPWLHASAVRSATRLTMRMRSTWDGCRQCFLALDIKIPQAWCGSLKGGAKVDDGGPATTKWNDPRRNSWRSNDTTASSPTSGSSRWESMRSKLTEATCNIRRREARPPARRVEQKQHLWAWAGRRPRCRRDHRSTRPNAPTARVEGRCHCHLSCSFCSFDLSHFFFPLGGVAWRGTGAGRRENPHIKALRSTHFAGNLPWC